jgi:hypothetical protein
LWRDEGEKTGGVRGPWPGPSPTPAEPLAGAAYVLASYLAGRQETDAQQTAQLLADALERQAKLLRFP